MRILPAEPLLTQQEHLVFNAGVIENMSSFSPEIELLILANKAYCEKLQGVLGERNNVKYRFLFEIKQQSKVLTAIILILNFFKFWIIYLKYKPIRTLFFTIEFTVFPTLFVCCNWLFTTKINFIIHQSLPLTRANWVKKKMLILFLGMERCHFICLSKTVLHQILKKYKIRSNSIWQHPILDDILMAQIDKKELPNDRYKLLLFGKQFDNLTKNDLEELLYMIAVFNSSSDIPIELTMPENDTINGDMGNFIIGLNRGYLSREHYLSLLANHHFILFLNDVWSEIRASGVAMDAIKLDTIPVAPDVGFFSDLKQFSKHEYAYLYDQDIRLTEKLKKFFKEGIYRYKDYLIGCRELSFNLSLNRMCLLEHLL